VGLGFIILLSLLLHLLLDLVPHWDYTGQRRAGIWALADVLAAIVVVVVLALIVQHPSRAIVAAVASAVPDLDVLDAVLSGGTRRRWFPSHWRSFPHGKAGAAWGVPTQVAVIAISVAVIVVVR
jgi:hypothetical protein